MALLEVEGLTTEFRTHGGTVRAVDDVSFHIDAGETLALVGESGSGKSVTAQSIMRLVARPAGRIASGSVYFKGRDLMSLSEKDMRRVRGSGIGMIFQDPMSSLNPALTIGRQITESLALHLGMRPKAAERRAVELLTLVGIPAPESRISSYPHQLSGGMRQRVMIAIALACDPELILADEITTALDVTIQAQILELLKSITEESGTAVLFITHDLGVVAGVAERVNVMYAGQIVERATTTDLFRQPRMPYTWGLLGSVPRLDQQRQDRLRPIPGSPPDLREEQPGCRFADRCKYAQEVCRESPPELLPVELKFGPGHEARCFATHDDEWLGLSRWPEQTTKGTVK
ncbi:ABC transporter ATP-binding protein [Leucobacter albus]|uniref:ABC transporter ATP-binding protein n=1 Tax=Leucobacter albus TaxID=272210 RepID=A0ABW3TSD4_9MICO